MSSEQDSGHSDEYSQPGPSKRALAAVQSEYGKQDLLKVQHEVAETVSDESESLASETGTVDEMCAYSLELLPDDVLLCIMSLLDVKSVVLLSRVCKRFYHLHQDPSVWRDVHINLGLYSENKAKAEIISKYLGPSTWRIKLSNGWDPLLTAALLDELFTKCPNIRSITLRHCLLHRTSCDCKFYHCESLEQVFLDRCGKWTESVKPTWPKLTHLCLSDSNNASDSDLKYFASCQETATSLRVLDISFDARVTNAGVNVICKSMPNLHTLRLERCHGLTEESMEDIAKLQHLQHLHFGPYILSESSYFKFLKLFPRLTSLHVHLNSSTLQSVRDSEATTAYRDSGVDLHLHEQYDPDDYDDSDDYMYDDYDGYDGYDDYDPYEGGGFCLPLSDMYGDYDSPDLDSDD